MDTIAPHKPEQADDMQQVSRRVGPEAGCLSTLNAPQLLLARAAGTGDWGAAGRSGYRRRAPETSSDETGCSSSFSSCGRMLRACTTTLGGSKTLPLAPASPPLERCNAGIHVFHHPELTGCRDVRHRARAQSHEQILKNCTGTGWSSSHSGSIVRRGGNAGVVDQRQDAQLRQVRQVHQLRYVRNLHAAALRRRPSCSTWAYCAAKRSVLKAARLLWDMQADLVPPQEQLAHFAALPDVSAQRQPHVCASELASGV